MADWKVDVETQFVDVSGRLGRAVGADTSDYGAVGETDNLKGKFMILCWPTTTSAGLDGARRAEPHPPPCCPW